MNSSGMAQERYKEHGVPTVPRVKDEIQQTLDKPAREDFTGEVVFRLSFNQGGVRNTKMRLERAL